MNEKIEIRSESMRDIIGYIPNWIIRWGITVAASIVFILLIGTCFFKYPDIIYADVVITTDQPVAPIISRSDGKLDCLFVNDNDKIKKNKILAIINNPANYKDVYKLKEYLMKLQINTFSFTNIFFENKTLVLGELQLFCADFERLYLKFQHFGLLDYHNKKIALQEKQINKQNKLYDLSIQQKNILKQEVALTKKQYNRASQLTNREISLAEFEEYQGNYFHAQRNLKELEKNIENINLKIVDLEDNILELQLDSAEKKKQLQLEINKSLESLISQISLWEQKYVLKSPIDGEVSFNNFWSINQNVKIGEIVITILPTGTRNLVAKLQLPLQGAGKVVPGQTVNIKLDGYPFKEYGTILGKIEDISDISADKKYSVEVSLPSGLKTSYKKTLDFSQEMHGMAEIITDDIILLARILSPIKAIMEKHYVKK